MTMKNFTNSLSVGDWVYSDSPGIWRVTRIIEGIQKLSFNLEEQKRLDRRRLVLCKRFINEEWKPKFGIEIANAEFVQAITDDDRKRLGVFIDDNPGIFQEFEAYEPKGVDHAMDIPLYLSAGVESIQTLIPNVFIGITEEGLTNDEILRVIESDLRQFTPKTIRNAVLRFVCQNHEVRNNEYVFREVHLLQV